MSIPRVYATWNQVMGGSCTGPDDEVFEALGGWPGYPVDAIARDYRAAINDALPEWLSLHGDEFYSESDEDTDSADSRTEDYPLDESGDLDLKAIIEDVNFTAIVEAHDDDPVPVDTLVDEIFFAANGSYAHDEGVRAIDLSGWTLRAEESPTAANPHRLLWWADSPDEQGALSGGWDVLPACTVAGEAADLVSRIRAAAAAAAA